MNYKTRMLDEILELQIKIVKFEKYINSKTKDPQNPSLEEKQLDAMKQYFNALYERLFFELNDKSKICEEVKTCLDF